MATKLNIDFNSLLPKVTSGISGVTDILGNTMEAARIADTSGIDNQLSYINNLGRSRFGTYEQLNNEFSGIDSLMPALNYDQIRGMSDGQKVGNVLSSTLTGATTGLSVGGPWGALAGAVVGLGSGIGGVLAGDAKASTEYSRLKNDSKLAQIYAGKRYGAAQENLVNYNHRNEIANVSASGGSIARRQLSMKEFETMVNRRNKVKPKGPVVGIVREMCDGGVRVRIKR